MNKRRILVVEDEALVAANLVQTLTLLGYTVHKPVATGEDAIHAVIADKPDLVLMDIELLGTMTGIEAAEKIRAIADIPVVYLTAHTDDLCLKKAQITEPYGYIVKPAHSSELNATIEMALYRHALDRKLKESEEKFRNITQRISDLIVVLDPEGYPTYVSPSITSILGFPQDSFIGKRAGPDIIHQDDVARTEQAMKRLKNGSLAEQVEFRMKKSDGSFAVFEGNGIPVIKDGVYAGVQMVARDITKRKLAEEALQSVNERLRYLLASTSVAIYTSRTSGDFGATSITDNVLQITGYKPQDFIENSSFWIEHIHPEDKKRILDNLPKIFESGFHSYEYRFRCKDGKYIWILDDMRLGKDENGNHYEITGQWMDITERMRMEEALRESEAKYRIIVENTNYAIYIHNFEGKIIGLNENACRMVGYDNEELIGANLAKIDSGWRLPANPDLDQLLSRGSHLFERENICKDGSVIPVEVSAKVVNRRGKGTVQAFVRDISGRKRDEDALRESQKRFQALAETTSDFVWEMDANGVYTYCSPQINELWGYKPEDMIGRTPFDLMIPEDREQAIRMFTTMSESPRSFKGMVTSSRDNTGRIVVLETSGVPFFDIDGRLLGYRGISRDITERKRAEEVLRQANKKLNLLSSITRHDINNQLSVLIGYLRILEKKQPDTSFSEHFRKINAAAQRISAMIRFTREYEKIGVNVPVWQDCHTLVDIAAIQAPLEKVILKNDLPAGAEVFADPLVVKVCYNLMDNAVRYGGKITTIRFYAQESGDDPLIVCEDDGDGVPADDKEKIFEPGYGKNTGLGLFLAREILDITGISIRETGEPGKGARFEMTVPKGVWRKISGITN
jgi:PAS domain S-box-containing protein